MSMKQPQGFVVPGLPPPPPAPSKSTSRAWRIPRMAPGALFGVGSGAVAPLEREREKPVTVA
eukprot:2609549-Alexandrium_andersonii.AAC.1